MAGTQGDGYDYLFKILLVGDSGVGKSSLLLRFTEDQFEALTPTIGVDFKAKVINLNNNAVKLTIWDTAGQERFRTLTGSYYRGAQGIIYVYDVTRAETFDSLTSTWMNEVDMYANERDAITMVVANKVDLDAEREVSTKEGMDFARQHGCLFVETSAKANVAVNQAFEELVLKILDTPSLLKSSNPSKLNIGTKAEQQAQAGYCC